MTSEELKAKLKWLSEETWNKGNVDAMDDLFAADVVSHQAGLPDARGVAACKQRVIDFRSIFPDFHVTIEEVIAEGNTLAARWTSRGTWTGPSPRIPMSPTGKQATGTGTWMGHLEQGKVVEDWNNSDTLDWMQQIGVVPGPRVGDQ